MFVVNASFETEKKFEERLKQKAKKNKTEIEEAKGNLSFECWKKIPRIKSNISLYPSGKKTVLSSLDFKRRTCE